MNDFLPRSLFLGGAGVPEMAVDWKPRFKKGDRVRLEGTVSLVREDGPNEPTVTVKLDGFATPISLGEYYLEPTDNEPPPPRRQRRNNAN